MGREVIGWFLLMSLTNDAFWAAASGRVWGWTVLQAGNCGGMRAGHESAPPPPQSTGNSKKSSHDHGAGWCVYVMMPNSVL